MSIDPLAWLMLPPLAAVAYAPPGARGAAAGRVVILGYALATLAVAVGDLSHAALSAYGHASAGAALFVSLSAGLLLGGMLPWPPMAWRTWVAGAPLVVATTLSVIGSLRIGPWLLGAVLGAVPLLLGGALPTLRREEAMSPTAGEGGRAWLVASAALGLAVAGPMLLMVLAPLVAVVLGTTVMRRESGGWRPLVLPLFATLTALILGWLALTIAGDAMAGVATFFTTAPVSPAAERWLAMLGVLTVVAMIAPWPLHRFGPGVALVPAAVALAHRLSLSVAPAAVVDWLPLLGLLLVPSAVVAALRGHWAVALATAATLVALQPGSLSFVAAVLAAGGAVATAMGGADRNLVRPGRVTFAGAWWVATVVAAGATAATAAVLTREVVLATLLAAGLAGAAARHGGRSPTR